MPARQVWWYSEGQVCTTVCCSAAPDKDIWTLREWTLHPKHAFREHAKAQAVQALGSIPDKAWRRKIISALHKMLSYSNLQRPQPKSFPASRHKADRERAAFLHQTCNAGACGALKGSVWLTSFCNVSSTKPDVFPSSHERFFMISFASRRQERQACAGAPTQPMCWQNIVPTRRSQTLDGSSMLRRPWCTPF